MRTGLPFIFAAIWCASIPTQAQWVAVGSGMDMYVLASAVYNDELYASGNFEHADGIECLGIARWNGSAWGPVGNGFQHGAFSYAVTALIVFEGDLIAGGYVDSVSGIPIQKVARWNGTTWSPMGTNCGINTMRGFAIHNGELYGCGQGSGSLYPNSIEKWTGTDWVPIENNPGTTEVYSLASYNGELYASGAFTTFEGVTVNGIARWNGTNWSDVGGGIPGMTIYDVVRPLAVFDGKLYAGGHFLAIGTATVNDIASWDGSTWADVGGGVGGATAGVQSLIAQGDKLFVGGTFWTVNGVTANRAAYWSGGAWTVLGVDLGAGARSQAVYNNELYSFGEGAFNGHNYSARWSGDVFSAISEVNALATIQPFPNPVAQGGSIIIDLHGATDPHAVDRIVLFAADGRLVQHERIAASEGGRAALDLNGLAPGSYTIALADKAGTTLARGRLVVH